MSEKRTQNTYKTILVALDGSEDSLAGGRLALDIAQKNNSTICAVHVYDTAIHNTRFQEMEPGLPSQYRQERILGRLRQEHDTLMSEGFKALSLGYMEDFLALAGQRSVPVTMEAIAGRNYIGILDLLQNKSFDLVVLGATGLGVQRDNMLGSTALRVLRHAPSDVLIARQGSGKNGATVACIDGSGYAMAALHKAALINGNLEGRLHLFAAFDVAFHRTIFKTMARSLSAERQKEIGLDRQEAVHEELIDKSLEALYGSFLQEAGKEIDAAETDQQICLRPGKAYRAIVDYAVETQANLLALGRFGHNRESASDIGSHAEAVARLAPCHVLVCTGRIDSPAKARQDEPALEWEAEPLQRLECIPAHVRQMAKKAIEAQVIADGKARVTLDAFQKAAKNFGMEQ